MAGVVLCEPTELYNILNQSTRLSRLTETNYLCLLGKLIVSLFIIYLHLYPTLPTQDAKDGAAIRCARVLECFTRHPILILKGGYERFSVHYHFLRTQKIFWMPQELDAFQPYPVEILPAQLYMGNFKQAFKGPRRIYFTGYGGKLSISMRSVRTQLQGDVWEITRKLKPYAKFLGISRSSTAVMAFLIHTFEFPLKRAWNHVQKCKTNMRPNRGFVQQLSDWEIQIHGSAITDISEPYY
uniref:Serine/threonine/tyrosine interacting like 1 n=1 Tax=Sphenodon punctatus TaxID=8508 RepID=A0A8D0GGM7_SPHPU